MSLADELRAAGLTVKTVSGWGSRGRAWAEGKPVGVMHHHTAAPVPFPVDRLYGSLLKCNINTKPDGTVWLVAARACNYSSGPGSSVVLAEVKAGTPPTRNARERRLTDDTNGNPYFFNFENDHLGDGSSMPAVQSEAIAVATAVVLDHHGLEVSNVTSHAEWTARKRDPYWNGSLRVIETIRKETQDMALTPEHRQALDWLVNALASRKEHSPPWGSHFWGRFQNVWGYPPGPVAPVTHVQLGFIWNVLDASIRKVANEVAGDDVDVDAIVDAVVAEAVQDIKARLDE